MTILRLTKSEHGKKVIPGCPNFTYGEFASGDGSNEILLDDLLPKALQKIRNQFMVPVHITSGYRTPTYNKQVGGVSNSYHTKGQAVDFYLPGIDVKAIGKYAETLGLLGIGVYTSQKFVHIDTRIVRYLWINDGKEKAIQTHGGLPTYWNIIMSKCSLKEDTIAFMMKYDYPYDLLEKIALRVR